MCVGQRSRSDEETEAGLAPVIVQEAEVTLDAVKSYLLQGEHDAEEEEVEVHDHVMCGLHFDHSEPQGCNSH